MPRYFFQGDSDNNNVGTPYSTIFAHPLFDNPNVFPYFGYYAALFGELDVAVLAGFNADVIIQMRDAWATARPNEPFRWAYIPANIGQGEPGLGIPALFNHDSDKIDAGSGAAQSVWSSHGITQQRARYTTFFETLKTLLDAESIPDPVYVDGDCELSGGNIYTYGNPRLTADAHTALVQFALDARYDTETIDGTQTLAQYITAWRDLNGDPVATLLDGYPDLFPAQYQLDVEGALRCFIASDLGSLTLDWALNQILYDLARETWPNIECGNYNTFAASRSYPAYVSRPKETPVSMGAAMRADVGVMSMYGALNFPTWEDADIDAPRNLGVKQYYAIVDRYGINTEASAQEQLKQIVSAEIAFNADAMTRAAPNKKHAIWLAYGEDKYVTPANLLVAAAQFPPGQVSLVQDTDYMSQNMATAARAGISRFGLYEPHVTNVAHTTDILDFWYNTIQKLEADIAEPARRSQAFPGQQIQNQPGGAGVHSNYRAAGDAGT